MQIKKVLNNNVVVVETADQKEMIVMGRGIAFQKKTGDFIQEELIEKTFILETAALSEKLKELLSDIPLAHLRVADDIVQYAQEKLETDLKENIYLTLTDHVNFAISRYKKGFI
ncbi:Transcription antiterminator LicT [Listeria grayi]|uniref:Transcription antiterminator LicT n=1 Tax=Listeria grayi TaxID=1641 RepID=A0A378MER3_LISGR|nr:Transcription antiterminator LicT [Listeria grayi]